MLKKLIHLHPNAFITKKKEIMRIGKFCLLLLVGAALFVSCGSKSDEEILIGNWRNLGDFDGPSRNGACSFVIGNNAYIFGGFNTKSSELSDLWMYDSQMKAWLPKANLPGKARVYAVAFSAGGKGYVGLGLNDLEPLKDFWEYDPAADQWTEIAQVFPGEARYRAVAAGINNVGYIGTGYDGASNYKDFYSFTPTGRGSGTWKLLGSFEGSKRQGASVFVIDNLMYLVGGANNAISVRDVQCYNPSNDTWKRLTDLINTTDTDIDDKYDKIPRANAAAFVVNGLGYLTTGESGAASNSTTFEYDPKGDVWIERTSFRYARTASIGFSLGGTRGFVLTGISGSNRYDDFWEFFPAEEDSGTDY